MKIVINKCYGGFGLSKKAIQRYFELQGVRCFWYVEDNSGLYTKTNNEGEAFLNICASKDLGDVCTDIPEEYRLLNKIIDRNDKNLIQVVEELGSECNADCSKLKIVEIPDDIEWEIEEYDGIEWVSEKHRTWG